MARPVPEALASLLDALRCPSCGDSLEAQDGALRCPGRHTFDIARAGYVSLLTGERATSGDDDEMARARDRFLSTGAYAPIVEVVGDLAADALPSTGAVVEVGCGTGYYLAGLLDRFPAVRGLGLDTSGRALRFAARAHERGAAASWDVFKPFPLRDQVTDLVLDVFAPRNPAEFHRILRAGGRLIVVRPGPSHLAELSSRFPGMIAVDPDKEDRLHHALNPFFEQVRQTSLQESVLLSAESAHDLISMTPSARHLDSRSAPAAGPLTTTVSVIATAYRPR